MRIYELFSGNELVIAQKIQQRRYQVLIHSCIYYYLNDNLISDAQWNVWAVELRDLQNQYPEISRQVALYEYFDDWDASTGAFLPIELDWVIDKAEQLIKYSRRIIQVSNNTLKTENKKSSKRRLF